jgi:hypothetical protein
MEEIPSENKGGTQMSKLYPDAMLERLEWRRDIRNLMGRISADYSVREESQIFQRYWSGRDDVSLGVNDGWYVGSQAVSAYYAALGEEIALASKCVQSDFPEKLSGTPDDELYGVGAMAYIPFDSQVIEIADDGQTAKGLFNIRGSYSRVTPSGPIAYWLFGWAAVDYVLEDGQWKIWHMQWLRNVDVQCGTPFGTQPEQFPEVEAYAPMKDFKLPEPSVKAVLMENYRTDRPFTKSPKVPEPYETFADTFSYGM